MCIFLYICIYIFCYVFVDLISGHSLENIVTWLTWKNFLNNILQLIIVSIRYMLYASYCYNYHVKVLTFQNLFGKGKPSVLCLQSSRAWLIKSYTKIEGDYCRNFFSVAFSSLRKEDCIRPNRPNQLLLITGLMR